MSQLVARLAGNEKCSKPKEYEIRTGSEMKRKDHDKRRSTNNVMEYR